MSATELMLRTRTPNSTHVVSMWLVPDDDVMRVRPVVGYFEDLHQAEDFASRHHNPMDGPIVLTVEQNDEATRRAQMSMRSRLSHLEEIRDLGSDQDRIWVGAEIDKINRHLSEAS